MGLIVIVILLTLGFYFVVVLKNPTESLKEPFENEQLNSNYIVSFLKTTSDCNKYTMEDFIQDCAIERKLYCKGLDSCQYVNETLQMFLNETLDVWQYQYNFTIENIKENISFVKSCPSNTNNKQMGFQPISLYPYPGTVTVKLVLCT